MLGKKFDFVFHYAALVGVQRTQDNPVKVLRDIEGFKHVCSLTSLPIFAVGGITLESIPFIQEAGGNGVAVASVVYNSKNIKQTLQQLVNSFPPKT